MTLQMDSTELSLGAKLKQSATESGFSIFGATVDVQQTFISLPFTKRVFFFATLETDVCSKSTHPQDQSL